MYTIQFFIKYWGYVQKYNEILVSLTRYCVPNINYLLPCINKSSLQITILSLYALFVNKVMHK